MTEKDLENMTPAELEAWVEANADGPWEPNDVPRTGRAPMVPVTIRLPEELLDEVKAEAAKHGHRYQRYARALMLLGLRAVQGGARLPVPVARIHITEAQLNELRRHGILTLELRAS